jgi:hypothetical protein
MATIQNIVINDGAATPVAVTFHPIGRENNIVTLADQRLDVSEFWPILSARFDRANVKRATNHISIELSYPIVRAVDSVDTVVGTARFVRGQFVLPSIMTDQERAHVHAFVANAVNNAILAAYVTDLEPMF